MEGYWGRPAETAEMIVDGWLHTGDIAHLDDDGYVHVVDRKKDMIKPGGHGVWPREVEEVLAAHPDVAEVGVAGVPSPRYGESVKAFVVLRAGATLSADELSPGRASGSRPTRSRARSSSATSCRRATSARSSAGSSSTEGSVPRLSMAQVNGASLAVEERGGGAAGDRSSSATAC